jgi:hypothetical protein
MMADDRITLHEGHLYPFSREGLQWAFTEAEKAARQSKRRGYTSAV